MAGRKPKPTAVKKLEGNPGKRKLNTKNRFRVRECPTALHGYCRKRRQNGSGYQKN